MNILIIKTKTFQHIIALYTLLFLLLLPNLTFSEATLPKAQTTNWSSNLNTQIDRYLEEQIKNNPTPHLYITQALILQQRNDFKKARQTLIQAEIQFPDDTNIPSYYEKNIDNDPTFMPPPRQIIPQKDLSSIKLLGGGSTLVFKAIKNNRPVAAFKPHQTRHQSNYRSEIAAYRLAIILKSRFNIPYNEHVYFEYNDFINLYNRIKSNPNPKTELKDIITKKNDDIDYIHGTYKEWIPDFTEFPIELSSNWKPWLKLDTDPETLNAPASEIIPNIKSKHPRGEKLAQRLEKHMQDLTKKELALLISNLIVFDFLSNNWDRFSGVPSFWGINCQFKDKNFMSIDNGAAFPKTPNKKPLQHLMDTQRFSKLTYKTIKNLDHDITLNRLFPNPTNFEKERFETFWKQKEKFLEYCDKLIEQHGKENVLYFD